MDKILETLKKKLKNEKVLIACSTGIDSMVLLDLVMKSININNIVIAHVNHQKREQSILEEKYILEFSKNNNIKCYVTKLKYETSGNFQQIARNKRYEFFMKIAEVEKIKYILLAHHADDNLETILMRFLKSSSIKGYAGIEEETLIDKYILYRPLLKYPKQTIKNYAEKHNIKYFEDASNNTTDYTRNRIRKLITPILLEENPNLYSAVNYYNETLLEASKIIENNEINFIENKIMVNNNNNVLTYTILLKDYLELNDFMKKQILFRLLKKYNLSTKCIEETIKKISSSKTNIVTKINPSISLIKEYQKILFTEHPIEQIKYYQEIFYEGTYNLPNNTKIQINKNSCVFITTTGKICYNINCLPVYIRNKETGDKMNGKLVSDIITSKKIPYLIKKDILLLCDKHNDIIAILGIKGGK